jgi:NADH:ubiquinone oxidoreductase subunit C
LILLSFESKEILLTCIHSNQQELVKISDIYYAANIFENEIYDFYGKKIANSKNHILRLHMNPKNYFPKRKMGKPMFSRKKEFTFTKIIAS